MIRQFLLINRDGDTYDLNDLNSFLQNPNDLGMEVSTDYERIETEFVEITEILEQKTPKGEIVFAGYEEYCKFARFIEKKPLKLQYTTPAGTYSIDAKVRKLKKTELEEAGLVCDVEFEAYGTFYRLVSAQNTRDYSGKVYSYTYPYTYSDFLAGVVEVDVDSVYECPAKLTVFGPCKNPSWTHSVNGEVITRGKMNLEIASGNKLVVDTTQIPWSIREYDADNVFVADRYGDSDFSTERFVRLKAGKNQLVFSNEGIEEIKMIVEAKMLYGAV